MRITYKYKTIAVLLAAAAILICACLTVSVTLAYFYDARRGTSEIFFTKGVFMEIGNLDGIAGSRTLKFTGLTGGLAYPGTVINIEAPTIKLRDGSINAYARFEIQYQFFKPAASTTPLSNTEFNNRFTPSFTAGSWVYSAGYYNYTHPTNGSALMQGEIYKTNAWTSFTILVNPALTAVDLEDSRLVVVMRIATVQCANLTMTQAWSQVNFNSLVFKNL